MAKSRKPAAPKNERQVRFCEAWLENGFNHLEAFKTAGYSIKGQAWRVHANDMLESFKAYLEPLRKARVTARAKHLAVSEKDVLDELAAMAFANPFDYIEVYKAGDEMKARKKPFHTLTRREAGAITDLRVLSDGTVEYAIPAPKERRPALELVGKNLGMFHTQLIAEHRHIVQRRAADLRNVKPTVLEEIEKILIDSIGQEQARQFIGFTPEALSEETDDAASL